MHIEIKVEYGDDAVTLESGRSEGLYGVDLHTVIEFFDSVTAQMRTMIVGREPSPEEEGTS